MSEADEEARLAYPCRRYPDELLQYLRLVQLNKAQLRERTLEDLMFERKQTDVNELMVLDSLIEACQITLAGYPTTVSPLLPPPHRSRYGRLGRPMIISELVS